MEKTFSVLHVNNRELFDHIAIEYMKSIVQSDPTVGYYEVAHRAFDFAKCFLEVREQYVKP